MRQIRSSALPGRGLASDRVRVTAQRTAANFVPLTLQFVFFSSLLHPTDRDIVKSGFAAFRNNLRLTVDSTYSVRPSLGYAIDTRYLANLTNLGGD
jgi:hypothetical protein